MRLHEIASPTFYASTSDQQLKGTVIERIGSINRLGAALEGKLEARRPPGCLPRQQSLYLELAPSDGEFVYAVKPIGKVDRQHTSWLKQLETTNIANQGEVDQLVQGYWSGKPIPEAQDEPWEYRALQVKLIGSVRKKPI